MALRTLSVLSLALLAACRADKSSDSAGADSAGTDSAGADSAGADSAAPVACPLGGNAWVGTNPLGDSIGPDAVSTGIGDDWLLWYTASDDLVDWSEPVLVGHDLSSVDVFVCGERLVLAGMYSGYAPERTPTWVTFYSTTDLSTWTGNGFDVSDASNVAVMDPAFRLVGGALSTVWWGRDEESARPLWIEGDHPVYAGSWTGADLNEDAVIHNSDYLADPIIVEFGGLLHLFYTHGVAGTEGQEVVHAVSEDGGASYLARETFADTSVPFAFEHDGGLMLLTQSMTGANGPWPRAHWSADGQIWEDRDTPIGDASDWVYDNCTSPGLGQFMDQWLFFCATDLTH